MYYLNMWFRQNLGLKIVSVIIALFLWAYVMVRENPAVVREMQVRVVLRNVPGELTVVSSSPPSARVVVSGLRRLVEGLSLSQIVLQADLSGRAAGEHTASLKPSELPPGVSVESLSPATVRVVLDKIATETRPLTVSLHGKPATGYTLGTPQSSRAEVQVTGAASLLARVGRVVAEADVTGLSGTAERPALVRVLDDNGDPIEGLRVSPTELTVVVPVMRSSQQTKTLPVRPQVGEPATGYKVSEVTARPAEVILVGSPEALEALEAVSTEPIPIAGLTSTETYKATLVLPGGVKREGEGQVQVTISVAKQGAGGPTNQPPAPPSGAPDLSPGTGGKPGPETTPQPPAVPGKPEAQPAAHSGGTAH